MNDCQQGSKQNKASRVFFFTIQRGKSLSASTTSHLTESLEVKGRRSQHPDKRRTNIPQGDDDEGEEEELTTECV